VWEAGRLVCPWAEGDKDVPRPGRLPVELNAGEAGDRYGRGRAVRRSAAAGAQALHGRGYRQRPRKAGEQHHDEARRIRRRAVAERHPAEVRWRADLRVGRAREVLPLDVLGRERVLPPLRTGPARIGGADPQWERELRRLVGRAGGKRRELARRAEEV